MRAPLREETRKGGPYGQEFDPCPRRFSRGMAGTFALAIGVSLLSGWSLAALVPEALMAGALGALILGRLCLGSFVFCLLRGKTGFAVRTLPWGSGE